MRDKVAAFLEIAGVFVVGTLVARLAGNALGLGSAGLRDVQPGQAIDYLALARSTAASLLLRYGFILGLGFAIGWWHRRRRLAEYGVTMAGLPVREHLVIAVVLFAVGGFLPRLIFALQDRLDLGASPEHWKLIQPQATLGYWLYMAAGSFVLVPIVEELFARGYVQTRMAEAFGAGAAIVLTALMFTLSHRQYFLLSVVGIGMLVSLLFASILGGYVRHRYGTLVPVILAHAMGNVPIRGWVELAVLAAMVVVIVIARRPIAAHLRDAAKVVMTRNVFAPAAALIALIAIVLGLAAISRPALLAASVAALATALVLESAQRRPVLQQ